MALNMHQQITIAAWDSNDREATRLKRCEFNVALHPSTVDKGSYMICKDNQSFSIVEDNGIKQLIHHYDPRYTMPICKHILPLSNHIISELSENVERRVKYDLQNADIIAVTTDL